MKIVKTNSNYVMPVSIKTPATIKTFNLSELKPAEKIAAIEEIVKQPIDKIMIAAGDGTPYMPMGLREYLNLEAQK